MLGTASTIVAEPLLADEFGAGSLGYGLLTACWGGGTIVGAWLSRGMRREREARMHLRQAVSQARVRAWRSR